MEINEDLDQSVFRLITSLCEKFYSTYDEIKLARSMCYEILLGKKTMKNTNEFLDLEGTSDPYLKLLSWQFNLIHEYDMKKHADELSKVVSDVESCFEHDPLFFKNVLTFLMSLRNVPKKVDTKLDLSSIPSLDNFPNYNKLFQLPDSFKELNNNLKTNSSSTTLCQVPSITSKVKLDILLDDESSSESSENIWQLASRLKYNTRKTWESYGYSEPEKERPFLSELGPLSSLWVENLESLYMFNLFKDKAVLKSRLISRKEFIKDLQYLLVGMASETFAINEEGFFYLIPEINIEAITPDTLKNYCSDLLFTGTCCKALNKFCTPNSETGRYKYQGYIFSEFCESLNRYLKFYQTAVFSISNNMTYLQFHQKTYELRSHIRTLASLCKVGPYMSCGETISNGVILLNYLFKKVISLTDQKLIYALYAMFYPCCQVYFSRFLKPWLLEGTLHDPYGEFFIQANTKYVISRGRTYWTRSFSFREDLLPDFLIDLKSDILWCGKAMSLLQLSARSSKLTHYLMGTKPHIISCCITSNQLDAIRKNVINYYLDVQKHCGPRFCLLEALTSFQKTDPVLLENIVKKRETTLRRIELEREKLMLKSREKKTEQMNILKEQYDSVLAQKQAILAQEVEEEMNQIEKKLESDLKRHNLVQDEAAKLIAHYTKLCEAVDNENIETQNHIKEMKNDDLEEINGNMPSPNKDALPVTKDLSDVASSEEESYYSTIGPDEINTSQSKDMEEDKSNAVKDKVLDSSWDIVNANVPVADKNANVENLTATAQQALENFEIAKRNKHRVMTEELGFGFLKDLPVIVENKMPLTQAQKNKLKIMRSEFDIPEKSEMTLKIFTLAKANRNRVMGISDCFKYKVDNENFVNKNIKNQDRDTGKTTNIKKSISLNLNLEETPKLKKSNDQPIPMSVDSTPLVEFSHSLATTPSTSYFNFNIFNKEVTPTTADTNLNDDFNFNQENVPHVIYKKGDNKSQKNVFSKRINAQEVSGVCTNALRLLLRECIQIPLVTQMKLINTELLRYFIEDLEYLKHLSSLRDYFFLQDGEFGRHITDKLFTKLYEANVPAQLINCRILKDLVFGASDLSNKNQAFSCYLSFRINSVPKCFDLGNPGVLDCLSLTYKVNWPLNIILPSDAIAKYDEVFRFLIKLNRVSWVLKKTYLELKVLARETGKKEIYLMASPQYRKLHKYRHIMMHFILTLQNYVIGEVLQTSWAQFEKNLSTVKNIDQLYETHTSYIKNILFMCLLSQKTAILQNILNKTFTVILKFYDYLRSRSWTCEQGFYTHPNFDKLESIFKNFQEFELYFFKVIKKVINSGYQPHLTQLLEILDINYYFTDSLKIGTC